MHYVYLENIVFKTSSYPNLPKEVNLCSSCYSRRGTWVLGAVWEYSAGDGKRTIDVEMDICPVCATTKAVYPTVQELIQQKVNLLAHATT